MSDIHEQVQGWIAAYKVAFPSVEPNAFVLCGMDEDVKLYLVHRSEEVGPELMVLNATEEYGQGGAGELESFCDQLELLYPHMTLYIR